MKKSKTIKVKADVNAYCDDCGKEYVGKGDPIAWARRHVIKTGHIAGVTVTYDIFKNDQ